PAVLRRYPDPRVVQKGLELPDPGFLLALVLAGCLVRLVLPEVALLAAVADVLGDDGPVRDQLLQLLLGPVIGALRKPGRFGLAHGLHVSLVGRGKVGTGARALCRGAVHPKYPLLSPTTPGGMPVRTGGISGIVVECGRGRRTRN